MRSRFGLGILLLIAMTGCALFQDWQVTYLQKAKGSASEAEVRHHLGKPRTIHARDRGWVAWQYHFWTHVAGDINRGPEAWCDEYWLLFDERGTLRAWTHSRCSGRVNVS